MYLLKSFNIMKPRRIILVRHAQSQANVDKSVYERIPDHAFQITETGVAQARKAGREVRQIVGEQTIQAYVSPFTRTRQTYTEMLPSLADNIIKKYEDPRIREQALGNFQSVESFMKTYQTCVDYGRFYYQVPDGESSAMVYTRICSFIETLYRDFERDEMAENCLIVSHGLALRVFVMALLRESVEYFESLNNPNNCQCIVFERQDSGEYVLKTTLEKRPMDAYGY